METQDTGNEEETAAKKTPNNSCCEPSDAGAMPDCCKGTNEPEGPCSMMSKCMKGCRWFPLMPLTIGIGLFALGYFLDAEVVRVLWLVLSGIMILAGILGFIVMSVISRK